MSGHALLGALVFLGALAYAAELWWRPRKRCRSCGGSGKVHVRGNRYDECRRCDGGRKKQPLRIGAQLVRPGLRKEK